MIAHPPTVSVTPVSRGGWALDTGVTTKGVTGPDPEDAGAHYTQLAFDDLERLMDSGSDRWELDRALPGGATRGALKAPALGVEPVVDVATDH